MATVSKKKQGAAPEKRGIWLNEHGTLSFGLGMANDVPIDAGEHYEGLKAKSVADRIEEYKTIVAARDLAKPKAEVAEAAK